MPDEMEGNRNATAQNDDSRKSVSYRRDADEKYQRGADSKDRSCDASIDHDLRHVDLRAWRNFAHDETSVLSVPLPGYRRRLNLVAPSALSNLSYGVARL